MPGAFSRFGYEYRDASNYKAFDEVLLIGAATDEARAVINGKLNSDGCFVPELVGLAPLQSTLEGFPSEDDHIWHQFLYLLPATDREIGSLTPSGELSNLLSNFEKLEPWESPAMLKRIALLFHKEPYSLIT